MSTTEDRERNQIAYRKLKDSINRTYPPGRCVAIYQGQLAADAPTFQELSAALVASGKNPRQALVVQAGVDYPEEAIILLPASWERPDHG
jgi:hypothetical protein